MQMLGDKKIGNMKATKTKQKAKAKPHKKKSVSPKPNKKFDLYDHEENCELIEDNRDPVEEENEDEDDGFYSRQDPNDEDDAYPGSYEDSLRY